MKKQYERITQEEWFEPSQSIRADCYLLPGHDEYPDLSRSWEERRLWRIRILLFLRALRRNSQKIFSQAENVIFHLTTEKSSQDQIADRMHISRRTVSVHQHNIRTKVIKLIETLGGMNVEALNHYVKPTRHVQLVTSETRARQSAKKRGSLNPRFKGQQDLNRGVLYVTANTSSAQDMSAAPAAPLQSLNSL